MIIHESARADQLATPEAAVCEQLPERIDRDLLKAQVLDHLYDLGIGPGRSSKPKTKEAIRFAHSKQRAINARSEIKALGRIDDLASFFADGSDISPQDIRPRLIRVESGKLTGRLFRFAALTWAVPVSRGFGRRLRYLVMDTSNRKLIGLIALGDPVFNLASRDKWIGWDSEQRKDRLANVMDAYVLGAVPPYNLLLGGKLVGSLLPSTRIYRDFRDRYGSTTGIISGKAKRSRLSLITVTSALGRSSMYNRLRLSDPDHSDSNQNVVEFIRLGFSGGWGHFHFSDELFAQFRHVLSEDGHKYVSQYKFGNGPNWKIRVIRAALKSLDLNQEFLRHGFRREVFAVPIARNWEKVLSCGSRQPGAPKLSVRRLSELAKDRWVIPRAERTPEYRDHDRRMVIDTILGSSTN